MNNKLADQLKTCNRYNNYYMAKYQEARDENSVLKKFMEATKVALKDSKYMSVDMQDALSELDKLKR